MFCTKFIWTCLLVRRIHVCFTLEVNCKKKNIFVAITLQNTVLFLFLQIQHVATGYVYEKHVFDVSMVYFLTNKDCRKWTSNRSWLQVLDRGSIQKKKEMFMMQHQYCIMKFLGACIFSVCTTSSFPYFFTQNKIVITVLVLYLFILYKELSFCLSTSTVRSEVRAAEHLTGTQCAASWYFSRTQETDPRSP